MKKFISILIFISCFLLLNISGAMGKCEEGDCVNGKGTYKDALGNEYDGEWKNGKKHGTGTLILKNEKEKYKGQWLNGMRHGKGLYKFKNGETYDGDWVKDKRTGKGTYIYFFVAEL